jgi:hypothetical protein
MSIGIYFRDSNGILTLASSGTSLVSPITTVHDGKEGDDKTVLLYLRNTDNTKWYSNIRITPVDLEDANPYGDVAYSETGWGVKLSKGGTEPTEAEWEDIDWGEYIDMDNVGSDSVGDSTTYFPFWYLISCPPNTDAQNKVDIVFQVAFTENAVI